MLLTKAFAKGPPLTRRIQGQGVAVVGTSAYFFGGEHPAAALSDEFWRLDGSQYPPIRVDLAYVSPVDVLNIPVDVLNVSVDVLNISCSCDAVLITFHTLHM